MNVKDVLREAPQEILWSLRVVRNDGIYHLQHST